MTINNNNKNTYESDDVVEGYRSIDLQPPEVMIFYQYKVKLQDKSILDIGCGTGRTTHYLSQFTNQYCAIDYSSRMVAACKQSYPDVPVTQNDVCDLTNFADSSFDNALFSYNGIDYLDQKSRLKGMSEIHRILKKNGLFIFSTHNRDFLDKLPRPTLQFSLNPIRFLININSYLTERKNYRNNKSLQSFNDDHQIIIDPSDSFRLLTYYITIEKQISQLSNLGFEVIDLFDLRGNRIEPSSKAKSSCWIYFVAKKL